MEPFAFGFISLGLVTVTLGLLLLGALVAQIVAWLWYD